MISCSDWNMRSHHGVLRGVNWKKYFLSAQKTNVLHSVCITVISDSSSPPLFKYCLIHYLTCTQAD